MRHQKSGRKFSRTSAHRSAMFSNMLASLVMHERIETTEPKAKELRRIADRTISWGAQVGEILEKPLDKRSAAERAAIVHAIRMARRTLRQGDALDKLFSEVAPRFKGRAGGYTRLLKTRTRTGDAAPMAYIELTVMAPKPEKKIAAPAPEAADAGGEAEAKPAAKKASAKAAAPKAASKKAAAADAGDAGEAKAAKPKAASKAKAKKD